MRRGVEIGEFPVRTLTFAANAGANVAVVDATEIDQSFERLQGPLRRSSCEPPSRRTERLRIGMRGVEEAGAEHRGSRTPAFVDRAVCRIVYRLEGRGCRVCRRVRAAGADGLPRTYCAREARFRRRSGPGIDRAMEMPETQFGSTCEARHRLVHAGLIGSRTPPLRDNSLKGFRCLAFSPAIVHAKVSTSVSRLTATASRQRARHQPRQTCHAARRVAQLEVTRLSGRNNFREITRDFWSHRQHPGSTRHGQDSGRDDPQRSMKISGKE